MWPFFHVVIHGRKIFEKNKFLHSVKVSGAEQDGIVHLYSITTENGSKMAKVWCKMNLPCCHDTAWTRLSMKSSVARCTYLSIVGYTFCIEKKWVCHSFFFQTHFFFKKSKIAKKIQKFSEKPRFDPQSPPRPQKYLIFDQK